MWKIFSLLLLLQSNICLAEILSLDHFSVEGWKTLTRRDPYQPQYTDDWSKGGRFNFDLRVGEYFSWKNQVHFDGTPSQLQHAGWLFDVSFDKYQIQPFYTHHSQHSFDDRGAEDPSQPSDFPLIDRYGLRFVFFQR